MTKCQMDSGPLPTVCEGITPPSTYAAGSSGLELSDKERAALREGAKADMNKYGFKTVDELIAYYDSKRGY